MYSFTMTYQQPIAKLQPWADKNPDGRAAYILTHGKIEGDVVIVDDALQSEVNKRFLIKQEPIEKLQAWAEKNPKGRASYVLAHGKIEGNVVILDDALQREMKEKFSIKRHSIAKLQQWAEKNPEGRAAYTLAHGKIEDDVVIVDDALQLEIKNRFPPKKGRFQPGLPVLLKLERVRSNAGGWPPGFTDLVLEVGKIEGEAVVLNEVALKEIRGKFPLLSFQTETIDPIEPPDS